MRQPNLPAFDPPALPDVRPGDIFALGRHRMMCGDATKKEDVARLFDGRKPTLVVTSPPYAKQRDYDRPITCWDNMMMGALDGHAFDNHVQLLINLGATHKNNEVDWYWLNWSQQMRFAKHRFVAQYVWDKLSGYPGAYGSRLAPAHEYIFHFNKKTTKPNKHIACYGGRKSASMYNLRKKNGDPQRCAPQYTHQTKIGDSVIRLAPVRFGEASGHPAQMPIALAAHLIGSWKRANALIYDPFAGSGTTLLAAEQENVNGLAMEIAPAYVKIALERWRKVHPDQRIERLNR